jgi:hypothetical protein
MGMVRDTHNLYEKAESGMFTQNCRMNVDVKGIVWKSVGWIHLAQGLDQWRLL